MNSPQIVGLGGYPDDVMLDHLLGLARGRRVLYVPTAGAEDPTSTLSWYSRLHGRAELSHLQFFPWPPDRLRELTLAHDLVLVGGGNTANMLAIWRLHGVAAALRSAYAEGTVLSGWSAGCLCWFEGGITDSFTHDLGALRDGLGLLSGSACPHYDSEEARRPVYAREIADGLAPGIALEDGVAARYDDERLVEVVSARPEGRAFHVDARGERPLPVRVLS